MVLVVYATHMYTKNEEATDASLKRRQSTLHHKSLPERDAISSDYSITVEEMAQRERNGEALFQNILNEATEDRDILYDINSWNVIVDYIYQNIDIGFHLKRLNLLRHIVEKSTKNINPFKSASTTLTTDIDQIAGSAVFLRGIGFHRVRGSKIPILRPLDDQLLVATAAMASLQLKIDVHIAFEGIKGEMNVVHTLMSKHTKYIADFVEPMHKWTQIDLNADYGKYHNLLSGLEEYCQKATKQQDLALYILRRLGFPKEIREIPISDTEHSAILDAVLLIYRQMQSIERKKERAGARTEDIVRIQSEGKGPMSTQPPMIVVESVSIDYDDDDVDLKENEEIDLNDIVIPISAKTAPNPDEAQRLQSVGISQFEITLNNSSDENVFSDLKSQKLWNMLLGSMCSNLAIGQSLSIKALLNGLHRVWKISKRVLENDPGANRVTADHQFEQKFRGIMGIDLFLRGIGYIQIDDGASTKYEYLGFNREKYRPVIKVAQSAILQKMAMLKLQQRLQRSWDGTLQSMFKALENEQDESRGAAVSKLTAIDLVRDYSAYYALLFCAESIGNDPEYNDDRRKIAAEIFNRHFGVKLEIDDRNLAILQRVYSVYDVIRQIEELRAQQNESGANTANLRVVMNQSMDFGAIPDLMRDATRSPTTMMAVADELAAKSILDEAADFAVNWTSDKLSVPKLTDDELYAVYFGTASDAVLAKASVSELYEQQLDEYWNFIQNMDEMEKVSAFDEYKCDDPHCQWDPDVPPLAMAPNQILHVMMYHTAGLLILSIFCSFPVSETRMSSLYNLHSILCTDYKALKEGKGNRFTETPTTRDGQWVGNQTSNVTLTYQRADSLGDQLTPGNYDYIPGAAENWEEGRCDNGDECAQLKRVLDACRDITKLHDAKQLDPERNDIVYDMDHCLLFHADKRLPELCTNPECVDRVNESGGVNRFIQFHHQFYHNEPIGISNEDEVDKKEMEQNEEGQIGYKSMSDVMSKAVRFEFGQPFNLITEKRDAKWKDPREEILKNDYCKLDKAEWNELLRKCIIYSKSRQAKAANLKLKEIVALKLYTDCDDLQRVFRRCFREKDLKERKNLQRNFFHWNKVLETACKKAKQRVSGRLYHGINDERLLASAFNGIYYGL